MKYLNKVNKHGIKFALSNVTEHKRLKNEILIDWAIENQDNIHNLSYNYSNSNYNLKDKKQVTKEVLITNYKKIVRVDIMKNTKNEKNNKRIMKVVYFDEESAVDYINIKDGGILFQSSEKEKKNGSNAKIDTQASLEGKISLLNFLKGSARAEIDSGILQYGQNIVKSTITNTILTDYIEKANNDKNIRKFEDFTIKPIANSLTYWKLYTPYTMIFKDQLTDKISPEIDIKKLDELIDIVKGYYELVAEKFDREKNEKVILRFNSKGFKNNYKLSNLLNMNLMYHGVLVGESTLKQYEVENEFDFAIKDVTTEDIKGSNKEIDSDIVKIYDVFLAGVEIDE